MARTEAWTRKEGKNPKGGLNQKGRDSYKKGTLKSSSGKKVTNKKQAKAIGLSMDSKAHGKKKK